MLTRSIRKNDIVADLVVETPSLARVFESFGINYCCEGNKPLAEAAHEKGIDVDALVVMLNVGAAGPSDRSVPNPASLSTPELVDHIVDSHHAYLRRELPRLVELTRKVASSHGEEDSRLYEVADTMAHLAAELRSHLETEEDELFPALTRGADDGRCRDDDCAQGAADGGDAKTAMVAQLIAEHRETANALERLRTATDEFTLPEWACNTYRAMLAALEEFEEDIRAHMHLENNALFPRIAR